MALSVCFALRPTLLSVCPSRLTLLSLSPGRVWQWNFDANSEDRSINLYHVHVFLSTNASLAARPAASSLLGDSGLCQVPAGLPRRWSQLTPEQLADATANGFQCQLRANS